jgi:putative transposase
MSKIARFVLWLCKNFTRRELEEIILRLQQILSEREPEIKPRDDFREKHPHYREFHVDPLAALTEAVTVPPQAPRLDWRQLRADYAQTHGRTLNAVQRRGGQKVPKGTVCPHCGAPADYLYLNDGRQAGQVLCKVCRRLSQIPRTRRKNEKTVFWCPYCRRALYRWKQKSACTLYKCDNDACPHYLKRKNALNWRERFLRQLKSSQFKLRYQYRVYHFQPRQLAPAAPERPVVDLGRIHRSGEVLGLVLAFHVSFALSARKTAQVLRGVFNVPLSYQTVLNYAQAAAFHCHRFNRRRQAPPSGIQAGDETYIRVGGRHHFAFFFVDAETHRITASHVAPERDVLAAATAMGEVVRTLPEDRAARFITDGNPAYMAGLHFLNAARDPHQPRHTLEQVLGLQNLDEVSERYRPFKQLIERFNRTYKYHVRSACGFATRNGAVALTTLFVTFYNFLRPHMTLRYRPPVELPELQGITTLQGRWNKILELAMTA